jgi:hypothetical protein
MIQHHAEEGTGTAVHPTRTFLEFLDATDQQESDYRNKKRAAHQQEQLRAQEDHEHAQSLNAPKHTPARADTAPAQDEVAAVPAQDRAPAPAVARAATIQAALDQLDLLDGDAAAKRAFLDTLPDVVFNEVKLVLQERKKAKDIAKQQRAAEIEDLL